METAIAIAGLVALILREVRTSTGFNHQSLLPGPLCESTHKTSDHFFRMEVLSPDLGGDGASDEESVSMEKCFYGPGRSSYTP